MADVDRNPPGTFCWPELTTTDRKGDRRLSLQFGWNVNESPIGSGEVYSMFQLRNRSVAAACALRPARSELSSRDTGASEKLSAIADPRGAVFATFTPAPRR